MEWKITGKQNNSCSFRLFMGSVSTYLVHKSPVPVTVIKPQKKKKATEKKKVKAAPLSESKYREKGYVFGFIKNIKNNRYANRPIGSR